MIDIYRTYRCINYLNAIIYPWKRIYHRYINQCYRLFPE